MADETMDVLGVSGAKDDGTHMHGAGRLFLLREMNYVVSCLGIGVASVQVRRPTYVSVRVLLV